jgi:hypothetical protein
MDCGVTPSGILLEFFKATGLFESDLPAAAVDIQASASRRCILCAALVDHIVDTLLL